MGYCGACWSECAPLRLVWVRGPKQTSGLRGWGPASGSCHFCTHLQPPSPRGSCQRAERHPRPRCPPDGGWFVFGGPKTWFICIKKKRREWFCFMNIVLFFCYWYCPFLCHLLSTWFLCTSAAGRGPSPQAAPARARACGADEALRSAILLGRIAPVWLAGCVGLPAPRGCAAGGCKRVIGRAGMRAPPVSGGG